LLHAIHTSDIDRLKRDCFLYYILRDYDAVMPRTNGHSGMDTDEDVTPGRAEEFARKRCLPKAWRVFMDGYWSLDNEEWEVGLAS
jgi:hypothetical protein